MRNPIRLLVGMITLFIAVSCNTTECKNDSPVLNEKTPDTKEYQAELAKILESGKANAVFTLDRYEEKDGIPYLYLSVQGKNLCATAVMLVLNPDENSDKLQKVKGEGYSGAEFKNLKYKVFHDETKTVLLYQGVEAIID